MYRIYIATSVSIVKLLSSFFQFQVEQNINLHWLQTRNYLLLLLQCRMSSSTLWWTKVGSNFFYWLCLLLCQLPSSRVTDSTYATSAIGAYQVAPGESPDLVALSALRAFKRPTNLSSQSVSPRGLAAGSSRCGSVLLHDQLIDEACSMSTESAS
jgi:hypothetical protein